MKPKAWEHFFGLTEVMKKSNLSQSTCLLRSFFFNEVTINLLSFCCQFLWGLDFLIILTGQPEVNVLFTKLGFQESSERCQTICKEMWKKINSCKASQECCRCNTHNSFLLSCPWIFLSIPPLNCLRKMYQNKPERTWVSWSSWPIFTS